MNFLDLFGAGFSLCATFLFTRVSMAAWPFGLMASCVNVFLFFKLGIYGDMALECTYSGMMLYGWLAWRGSRSDKPLRIRHVSKKQMMMEGGFAMIAMPFMAYFLKVETGSTVPWLDAVTTCLSLLAQWWLCRKQIETWIIWFIVDVFYAVLYFKTGIPYHALTYGVYCGLAIYGYRHWQKELTKETRSKTLETNEPQVHALPEA